MINLKLKLVTWIPLILRLSISEYNLSEKQEDIKISTYLKMRQKYSMTQDILFNKKKIFFNKLSKLLGIRIIHN